MTSARLDEILARFPDLTITVVGDFFLDKYFEIDPALAEISLETGLTANQVVGIRSQPGAAGTVVANLCALGVGEVRCLGFTGEDGEGFELRRGLQALGAEVTDLQLCPEHFTPTYGKPLMHEGDGRLRELERLDTKNRNPLPKTVEQTLITRLRLCASESHAVIALDQVQEAECGVITTEMRAALAELAEEFPCVLWFGDSRTRIGEYRNLLVKSNREETCRAVHPDTSTHLAAEVGVCASALARRTGRPVYVTVGEEGMVFATADASQHIPTLRVPGAIDIVGAGDSATAALVASLSAGANYPEAAIIGNVVASLTIQQIGTTGTANQAEVRTQFVRHAAVWSAF